MTSREINDLLSCGLDGRNWQVNRAERRGDQTLEDDDVFQVDGDNIQNEEAPASPAHVEEFIILPLTANFVTENRCRTEWNPDDINAIMKKDNVAVYAAQETAILREKEEYARVHDCWSFFWSFSEEELSNKKKADVCKKIRKDIEQLRDDENDRRAQLTERLTQTEATKFPVPVQMRKGGIALILNKEFFPFAEICKAVPPSQFHLSIIAITAGENGCPILISNIYGDSHKSQKNNELWETTMTKAIEFASAKQMPHVILGDANTVMDGTLDRKARTPLDRLQMMATIETHQYIDTWRAAHPGTRQFSHRSHENELGARLDYIFTNNSWTTTFVGESTCRMTTGISDHDKVIFSTPLTKIETAKRTLKPKFRRTYGKKVLRPLYKSAVEYRQTILYGGATTYKVFAEEATRLMREHQMIEQEERTVYVDKKLELMKRARKNAQKLVSLLHRIAKDNAQIIARVRNVLTTQLNGNNVSDELKIAHRIWKLQNRFAHVMETQFELPADDNPQTWLTAARKYVYLIKLAILRHSKRKRTKQIRKRAERVIDTYATDQKLFWKKMRGSSTKENITTLVTTDASGRKRYVTADHEILREVRQFYADLYTSTGEIDKEKFIQTWRRKLPNLERDAVYEKAIAQPTIEEVHDAIKSLATSKATGDDGLPAELWKRLTKYDPNDEKDPANRMDDGEEMEHIATEQTNPILETFYKLVCNLWDGGEIPEDWLRGLLKVLHKGGDPSQITNYRPITLEQTAAKIFSTILNDRLSAFVEARKIPADTQVGFRPSRSTTHAAYLAYEAIRLANKEKKPLHLVSIDFYKAYDSVEFSLLDCVLSEEFYGIPQKLGTAVKQIYRGRSIRVDIPQGLSEPIPLLRGVPQGDPISPLLFTLAINPLLENLAQMQGAFLHGENVVASAFADDISLLASTARDIELIWSKAAEYAKAAGMKINAKKSTYAANAYADQDRADLKIGNDMLQRIAPDEPFRMLGFWLRMDGSWEGQVAQMKKTLMTEMTQLRNRQITHVQYIDVLKRRVFPMVSYGLSIARLTSAELKSFDAIVEKEVRTKLRMQDLHFGDWFELSQDELGMGLPRISTLALSCPVAAILHISNGPECLAKKVLMRDLEMHATSELTSRTDDDESFWNFAQLAADHAQIHFQTRLPKARQAHEEVPLLRNHQRQSVRVDRAPVMKWEDQHKQAMLPLCEYAEPVPSFFRVVYTDGSEKDGRASWAVTTSSTERHQANSAKARVDGEQKSYVAELQAILVALRSSDALGNHRPVQYDDDEFPLGLLIATDSESSTKICRNFNDKSISEQHKTGYRHVIREILAEGERLRRLGVQIYFVHVPAHTDDADSDKIESETRRNEFFNKVGDVNGQTLIAGNKQADQLANAGRQQAPLQRDWSLQVAQHVDEVYVWSNDVKKVRPLVPSQSDDEEEEQPPQQLRNEGRDHPLQPIQPERSKLVEEAIQRFIKRQMSLSIKKKRTNIKNQAARTHYLADLDKADVKRSNITAERRRTKSHNVALYFFQRRMHALKTMEKLHRKGQQPLPKNGGPKKVGSLYTEYYKKVYPSPKCHACTKAGVVDPPTEDTEHCAFCESVPGKTELFEATWANIRRKIGKKSDDDRKRANTEYLRPFLAATRSMRDVQRPPDNLGLDSLRE